MARLISRLSLVVALLMILGLGLVALGPRVDPAALLTASSARGESAQNGGVTVEFLGWSHYRLTSPTGKVVVTNPFIEGNADAAVTVDEAIGLGANIILVTDGHRDEVGNSIELARGTGATLVAPSGELRAWFEERGVPTSQLAVVNPGAFYRQDGIEIQVHHAMHSSGARTPGEPLYYGGIAGAYTVIFENGYTVYFSGSSATTMDMQIWAELYKPHLAIVHMSANREPRDAGMNVKFMTMNNPNLKTVMPHHHRLQPQPGGVRPSDLQAQIQRMGLNLQFIEPEPLRPYRLTP